MGVALLPILGGCYTVGERGGGGEERERERERERVRGVGKDRKSSHSTCTSIGILGKGLAS